MQRFLEIACFNPESALIAALNGANRLELCDRMDLGGITPDFNWVKNLLPKISIPAYVMIRPRGGDFCYSKNELAQMKSEIERFKTINVKGFVFGVLTPEMDLNITANTELVECAKPFPCTLHRAFDRTNNLITSLENAIQCGFKTILTSGGQENAFAGAENLKNLVVSANKRIQIMPGGGVRSSNLKELISITNAHFYHSSAVVSGTTNADAEEIRQLKTILNS